MAASSDPGSQRHVAVRTRAAAAALQVRGQRRPRHLFQCQTPSGMPVAVCLSVSESRPICLHTYTRTSHLLLETVKLTNY